MSTSLYDLLERYDASQEYWDSPALPPAEWFQRLRSSGSSWSDVVSSSSGMLNNAGTIIVELALLICDIILAKGDQEAAIDGYADLIDATRDPKLLGELGYCLVLRCRLETVPLCEEDFAGDYYVFGSETVSPSFSLFPARPDSPGPEILSTQVGLALAIRAYGRAWWGLIYGFGDEGPSTGHAWRAWFALDGLRAICWERRDLEGLEAVLNEYTRVLDEYENWPVPPREVEEHFLELRGYFSGRRDIRSLDIASDDGAVQQLVLSNRLIFWQLRQLLEASRHATTMNPEQLEKLAELFAITVAKKMNKTPHYIIEAHEEALVTTYGSNWYALPREVRRLLIQAEYLRSLLSSTDADRSPVVLQYIRAIETMLRRTLGPALDRAFGRDARESFTRSNVEEFRTQFMRPQFSGLATLGGLSQAVGIAALGPTLDLLVRDYRNPAVHGAEASTADKAKELREVVLGSKAEGEGLIWKIARLALS